MGRDAFLQTLRFADSRGIAVFSDEVYRGLEQKPDDRLPAACDVTPSAVSLGVMSRTWGLPGLRIGWTATHDAGIAARMAELKDYTTICSSAPSELLAETALRHAERLAGRNTLIIEANLDLLDSFFARHADLFSWQRPKAGPSLTRASCPVMPMSCAAASWIRRGCCLAPGAHFGGPAGHFRIGFGRRNMPEALAGLAAFVDTMRVDGRAR